MNQTESKYIVGIEIGSSKIKAAAGIVDREGALTVHAVEEEKLVDCVRYGIINNVEIVATTLASILKRLEQRFEPRRIEAVYVAIGGIGTRTIISETERQLAEEMEITSRLIDQLKQEAKTRGVTGRDVMGITTRACQVDRRATDHPEGMYGQNIKLSFNLIATKPRAKCNLTRVITDKLNLRINAFVIRQLAEADMVLTNDEKRVGVVLVDFGAETTTVSIYRKGALMSLETIPMGSRNITRDLTTIHHLEERAEEIKILGGTAIPSSVPNIDSRLTGVDMNEANNYISARSGEIIANINAVIVNAGFKPTDLPGGIVIIGEGAKLREFANRVESVTKLTARAGFLNGGVRIADGRIQPNDAVDIISVLWAAAPDAEECMPEPAVTLDPVIEEPQEEPDDSKDDIPPAPQPVNDPVIIEERPLANKPPRRNFFSSLLDKIGVAMREGPVDDDDDDDDDDDYNDDDDRRH